MYGFVRFSVWEDVKICQGFSYILENVMFCHAPCSNSRPVSNNQNMYMVIRL